MNNNQKIILADEGLSKNARIFLSENARILCKLDENVRISTKMRAFSKNKFSDIGLASSKGLFFERPNKMMGQKVPVKQQFRFKLMPIQKEFYFIGLVLNGHY